MQADHDPPPPPLATLHTTQVIAINAADPLANELNDIADVEKKLPGVVSGIREWFRWYKTPDDKPVNAFGFGEKALPKADALKVNARTPCTHHSSGFIESCSRTRGSVVSLACTCTGD